MKNHSLNVKVTRITTAHVLHIHDTRLAKILPEAWNHRKNYLHEQPYKNQWPDYKIQHWILVFHGSLSFINIINIFPVCARVDCPSVSSHAQSCAQMQHLIQQLVLFVYLFGGAYRFITADDGFISSNGYVGLIDSNPFVPTSVTISVPSNHHLFKLIVCL